MKLSLYPSPPPHSYVNAGPLNVTDFSPSTNTPNCLNNVQATIKITIIQKLAYVAIAIDLIALA